MTLDFGVGPSGGDWSVGVDAGTRLAVAKHGAQKVIFSSERSVIRPHPAGEH